jgi:CRISPR-associated endoribonuclease Cas6
MPAIIELRLRPDRAVGSFRPATRQLHGLACALFEGVYSADHVGQEKPFSVWPLAPVADGWLLRAAWLTAGFPQTVLAACGEVRLGPLACTVTDLAIRPASHAELAAGPAATAAEVTLCSPTCFSQNGAHVVVPDPRLIAGSWRRRWNTSLLPEDGDLLISDGQWSEVRNALTLAGYDLHTEPMDTGHGKTRVGFAGTLTLRLDRSAPPGTDRILGSLARFAEFSGTGAQTTHGFGATSVALPISNRIPQRAAAPPARAARR